MQTKPLSLQTSARINDWIMDNIQALLKWQSYNKRKLSLNHLQYTHPYRQKRSLIWLSLEREKFCQNRHTLTWKAQSLTTRKVKRTGGQRETINFLTSLLKYSSKVSDSFALILCSWATFWWHLHFQTTEVCCS